MSNEDFKVFDVLHWSTTYTLLHYWHCRLSKLQFLKLAVQETWKINLSTEFYTLQCAMIEFGTVSFSDDSQHREDFLGLDAPFDCLPAPESKFIRCISRVYSESSPESLPKIRTFKPQHHRRSHHVVGHTAARRRFQLKSNSSLKIVTQ